MKKADRPRYWLTFLLKDLNVGDTFKPDILHLTIIPWFVTELADTEVKKSFQQNFSGLPAFQVSIGEQGEFKNKRRILVNFINRSADLIDLHSKAMDWFSQLGARWAVQNPHVADEYIPHIRRRKGHNVSEFEKQTVKSLSLVTANRRGDDLRTVIAKVDLSER